MVEMVTLWASRSRYTFVCLKPLVACVNQLKVLVTRDHQWCPQPTAVSTESLGDCWCMLVGALQFEGGVASDDPQEILLWL
jgi:hypothetical protein